MARLITDALTLNHLLQTCSQGVSNSLTQSSHLQASVFNQRMLEFEPTLEEWPVSVEISFTLSGQNGTEEGAHLPVGSQESAQLCLPGGQTWMVWREGQRDNPRLQLRLLVPQPWPKVQNRLPSTARTASRIDLACLCGSPLPCRKGIHSQPLLAAASTWRRWIAKLCASYKTCGANIQKRRALKGAKVARTSINGCSICLWRYFKSCLHLLQ